jgi:nucleotide-binding universal stress UspA family protein
MHVTVGIDGSHKEIKGSFEALASLKFKNLKQVDIVYVIENLGKADAIAGLSAYLDNVTGFPYTKLQATWSREAVAYATECAKSHNFESIPHILSGQIANRLLSFVQESASDILVLGSENKGSLESVMIGSVTRKCVIHSPISVLILKKAIPNRPIKAVLATDHSDYANRCIEVLARFAPQGFEEIIVTTVYPSQRIQKMMSEIPHFHLDADKEIRRGFDELNDKATRSLKDLNCKFRSRVEAGTIHEGLQRVVNEEGADLLIMGAQGHGFAERMTMGTVSLRMAMTGQSSILILRS